MIELKVEDYCQNCPDFYPESNMVLVGTNSLSTIISCEKARRCAGLVRYLKKEIEDKNASE